MRQDYSTKCVAVVDNGLFVELAATLADQFGQVFYTSPWESAFPKSNNLLVGKGIPGVTREDDVWGIADEVDLWVFPDVYHAGVQVALEGMGKRVWGSRYGEELELDRVASKQHLASLGIDIGDYTTVTGLDALREHLKSHEDVWVKISRTRGDMESFHAENYKLIEPRLDELEHVLGAKKHLMPFVVENAIEDAVEVGYDGYTIDGQFPLLSMVGIELKDKGYIGHMRHHDDQPIQIVQSNAAVAPTLKAYGYRNFFCLEGRIVRDGTFYVIDPCCRMGSPPGELVQVMYKNLPDIFWCGAEGECVDPEPAGEWGAELLLHSLWADKNWQAVHFPDEIREYVKLRNLTIIKGEYYVVPQGVDLPEIGAVVCTGDTMEEAVEGVKEYASQVQGYAVEVFNDSLDEARKNLEKLEEFGIEL